MCGWAGLQFVVCLLKSSQCHHVNAAKQRFGQQLCQICVIFSMFDDEWRFDVGDQVSGLMPKHLDWMDQRLVDCVLATK